MRQPRRFERECFEDMTALGVKEPDVVTRVTEYVPKSVDYIKGIMDNLFGYASNGSFYFDTNTYKNKGCSTPITQTTPLTCRSIHP
jgi:cysteinyl-tRNA synthetase